MFTLITGIVFYMQLLLTFRLYLHHVRAFYFNVLIYVYLLIYPSVSSWRIKLSKFDA